MGKLAELGTQSREGYLRNTGRLSQNLKDIGQKAEPLKRLATEGFGQIMFGDEGTIPWYMSLAPGADLMRKLYYEASPKDRRDIIGYLEKDYENDWIDDNDWFDYVSDIQPEYRKFLRRLENNEEYQNYLNSMTFTE